MTNPNLTHLALVLDRSGSMRQNGKAIEAEAGVRRLLKEQSELPGELHVTIVRFDTEYTEVCLDLPVDAVSEDMLVIDPRSMTALFDAIGRTITRLGQHFAAQREDERPGKVIMVIATDGLENASLEYTADTVGALIKEQSGTYRWEIVFLGTSLEQILSATDLGIAHASTIAAADTGAGLRSAFVGTSAAIGRYRAGGQSVSYLEEERIAAAQGDDV